MSNQPKYPISDQEMHELLVKYPFLRFLPEDPGSPDNDADQLEVNYYKTWDGTGWEDLWKHRYLPRLFKLYDSWDEEKRKSFQFTDVKSKYGEMRIYTTVSTGEDSLEGIAESLSGWICERCGEEPRNPGGYREIWTTKGWIMNLCKHCMYRELLVHGGDAVAGERMDKDTANKELAKLHHVAEKGFGYTRFSQKGTVNVKFRETPDGWLARDRVEVVK